MAVAWERILLFNFRLQYCQTWAVKKICIPTKVTQSHKILSINVIYARIIRVLLLHYYLINECFLIALLKCTKEMKCKWSNMLYQYQCDTFHHSDFSCIMLRNLLSYFSARIYWKPIPVKTLNNILGKNIYFFFQPLSVIISYVWTQTMILRKR